MIPKRRSIEKARDCQSWLLAPGWLPGYAGAVATSRDGFREYAQVLSGSDEVELALRAIWSPQAQAIQLQDTLKVGEQHLHLPALSPGRHIGVSLGQVPCQIMRSFMD